MNYCPVNFGCVTDGQTESDTYEPTVQYAQVGSKYPQVGSEIVTLAVGLNGNYFYNLPLSIHVPKSDQPFSLSGSISPMHFNYL